MLVHKHIVYGHFQAAMAELSSCNKDHFPCKAQHIYYLHLYRKSLPTLGFSKWKANLWKLFPVSSFCIYLHDFRESQLCFTNFPTAEKR